MALLKFLWIDDMEAWAKSAQKNLELIAPKYEVELRIVTAINGEDMDIEQKAMQFDFDCIFMDYHMEPKNGDKYIAEIRGHEHLEHIPIIFYSQDNSTDLDSIVEGISNITTVFRPNLEDKIKEMFF